MPLLSSGANATRKLAPKFIGPYPIKQVINPVAYRVDLPAPYNRIHNVFHSSLLEAYVDQADGDVVVIAPEPPVTPILPNLTNPMLDQVVGYRVQDNELQFLVRWLNMPNHEDTWVSQKTLQKLELEAKQASISPMVAP